jgi:enoyl-CoA hydratase
MALVEFDLHHHIGLLTINRPEVRNALNWQAMEELAAAIEQAHATPDLAAVLVTGASGAFISGGDIADLHRDFTEAEATLMIRLMGDALDRLAELPCVTMAAIEGPARGGGCEVALACDWRVAAEDATLGFVQVQLAITTGWGGAARLRSIVGYARALELLALGRVLSAAEAHRLGLVTHLAPPGKAVEVAWSLARELRANDPATLRVYKRILRAAERSDAEAKAIERAEFPKLWAAKAHRQIVESFLGASRKGRPD